MNGDAMRLCQLGNQFIERDLSFVGNARLNPVGQVSKFSVASAIALRARCQRSRIASQLDQIVHELRRYTEVPRRFAVPVPLIDKRCDPFA